MRSAFVLMDKIETQNDGEGPVATPSGNGRKWRCA